MPKKSKALAVRRTESIVATTVEQDLKEADELAKGKRAGSTREAYRGDVRAWLEYARTRGLCEYPVAPDAFVAWLGYLSKSGLKLSTIRRRCVSVTQWHRSRGDPSPMEDPRVLDVMKGLARKLKSAPKKKRALTPSMVRGILEQLPATPEGVRDRALVLVGIVTGMRRSELAAMEWAHVHKERDGSLLITIPVSKRDQEGKGRQVVLPKLTGMDLCPVEALESWKRVSFELRQDRTKARYLTRRESVFSCSSRTIARMLQRNLELLGYDPSEFGAHSFRSGFSTAASRAGASLEDLMQQTGHKSVDVARGYIQDAKLLRNEGVRSVVEALNNKEGDDE